MATPPRFEKVASIVDVSIPGSPSLIAAIPLGRSARDVVVDPVERLAYVGDDLGIQIVDVSNPLEAVGLLDANGDARDDRLLGRVAGATASRSLALSRSGTRATSGVSYLGVASSVTTQFGGPVLDWLRGEAVSEARAPPSTAPSTT